MAKTKSSFDFQFFANIVYKLFTMFESNHRGERTRLDLNDEITFFCNFI